VLREFSTYHFKPLLQWGSTLQVFSCGLNVELDFLFAQIDHVAGEQRLSVLFEVLLIGIKKTIQPWQELLGTVIRVKNDWNAVGWGNSADELSTCDSTSDRSFLLAIGNTLLIFISMLHITHSILQLTFPAKYAAPPWDIWRMMGAFESRAASSAAMTVDEDVTF
jgi:hypothetical protein